VIIVDSGGLGSSFDGLAKNACEVATKASEPAFFYWNASTLIIAQPGATVEHLIAQMHQREADEKKLTVKLRIEQREKEADEKFVKRGLKLSQKQNAKVSLARRNESTWLEIQPWAPYEVLILEWWQRRAL
jgi:hypothetical protein